MSRSFRYTPICGNTTAHSERTFKHLWHRGYRSRTRQQLLQEQEPLRIREYKPSNVWNGDKEGKYWFGGPWESGYECYWIQKLGSEVAYKAWWGAQTARMMRK